MQKNVQPFQEQALFYIKTNEQTHPGSCLLRELERPKCLEASLGIWQRSHLWLMSECFPFCEKLPGFKLYHVYAAVASKLSCWTLSFSDHWKAKIVPSHNADQPAGEQSKWSWICHALVRDRRRDRSGGVKKVGGKVCAQESMPYVTPSGEEPMIAVSKDLSLLCCQTGQPHSPALLWHVPTGQFRKNNPSFPLDQLPNPAPNELMSVHRISKEGVRGQGGPHFAAGRSPAELADS